MKLLLEWKDGREKRRTETELPTDLNIDQLQKFILEAIRDAYKYSSEEIPKGLDIQRDRDEKDKKIVVSNADIYVTTDKRRMLIGIRKGELEREIALPKRYQNHATQWMFELISRMSKC